MKLDYRRWPFVTIGECELRPPTIRVNIAALDYVERSTGAIARQLLERSIIAHELAHLLIIYADVNAKAKAVQTVASDLDTLRSVTIATEADRVAPPEHFANSFAAALLNLSRAEQEGISLAVAACRARVRHPGGLAAEFANETSGSQTRTFQEY